MFDHRRLTIHKLLRMLVSIKDVADRPLGHFESPHNQIEEKANIFMNITPTFFNSLIEANSSQIPYPFCKTAMNHCTICKEYSPTIRNSANSYIIENTSLKKQLYTK